MSNEIEAAGGKNVPSVYVNGFELGISNADITASLLLAGNPVASVFMSYTTAKTLSEALSQAIGTLEQVTKREIMTTHDVAKGLEQLQKKGPVS